MESIKDHLIDEPAKSGYPVCPVCGEDWYEYIIKDIDGRVCGCTLCMSMIDAEEYLEECCWQDE